MLNLTDYQDQLIECAEQGYSQLKSIMKPWEVRQANELVEKCILRCVELTKGQLVYELME